MYLESNLYIRIHYACKISYRLLLPHVDVSAERFGDQVVLLHAGGA